MNTVEFPAAARTYNYVRVIRHVIYGFLQGTGDSTEYDSTRYDSTGWGMKICGLSRACHARSDHNYNNYEPY